MKDKIAAFFREYKETSISPANFFKSEDPNQIALELGEFSPKDFEEIRDENDGSWQLGYFLLCQQTLTIRSLVILNTWRHDCNVTDNTFIGEDTFNEGMSSAEETFKNMSLSDQINAFLKVGIPSKAWMVNDTIMLSKHLKLTGHEAEIRDNILDYTNSLHDVGPSLSSLLNIIILIVEEKIK